HARCSPTCSARTHTYSTPLHDALPISFLDGRDTPPRSAESSLQQAEDLFKQLGTGRVASIVGRYFALDRDNRWDRVKTAYDVMVTGDADYDALTAVEGLKAAYERGENDEFVKATVICGEDEEVATINDGASVIFMNFRPDRAREITRAIIDGTFDVFDRGDTHTAIAHFVQTTEYASNIRAPIAYAPEDLSNSFGEYIAGLGKTQLRIAETEKYAHVTFFFN